MRNVATMVAEAKAQAEALSPDQVTEEAKTGALLVDLREPEERVAQGTVPGAVFAPRGMLEFWADPDSPYHRAEFDPRRRLVLYCASGGRSALAATTLAEIGFDDVAHLDGGLKAWKEAGHPVELPN